MTDITITISKEAVLNDVGRLTNYSGDRFVGDEGAFDRISTTGSDADMLGQFWQSACDGVTEAMKRFIKSLTTTTDYVVVLEVSSSYDTNLTGSITTNVQNCITNHIVSQWYKLTNKADSETYLREAVSQLNEAMSKLFFKKKPTRRSITH